MVSAFSSVYFLVLPIVIGAAQRASEWTEADLGSIASVYLLSFTIAGVLAAQFQKLFRFTILRVAASICLGGGFLVSGVNSDALQSVLIGHAIAGVGAGALYSASFNLVAAGAEPESAFGWKLSAEQALGASAFFAMTSMAFGFSGMLYSLAAIGFVSAIVFALAPYAKLPASQSSAKSGWPPILYVIGLLLIGIMMGALSGLWAFLEPVTQRAGISQELFGQIGAAGLLLGGLGGLTAGILGARFGNAPPLVFATICLFGALVAFSTGLTSPVAVAAFAFSFIWNLALAYQLSVASRLDETGAFAGWMSPTIAAGATLGPILAGVLLSGLGSVQTLLIVTGVIGGSALLSSAMLGKKDDVSEARGHSA
jgi:MFS family permease